MKNKTLYLLSGIIGVAFIIVLIILRATDKIKLGNLLIFSGIIIALVIFVDVGVTMFQGRKLNIPNKTSGNKTVSLDEVREIAKKKLMEVQYAEYEKEKLWEDILGMGRNNTPTYFKLVRGEFERKLYGIIINMVDTERGGIKPYDDTKMSEEKIKQDMLERGNLAAFMPSPTTPMRTTEIQDPMSGKTILTREPSFARPAMEEKNEEGGLQ